MATYKLPSMEHTFSVEIKGKETNKLFAGEFTYRRPNLRQKAEIQKNATRMNGDLKTLPDDVKIYHEMLAQMMICLVSAPDWWRDAFDGTELYDVNIVQELYRECMLFEQQWSANVWGDKPEGVAPEAVSPEEKKDEKKTSKGKTNVPNES